MNQLTVQANCPSCNHPLKKLPVRKTKCPNCGDFMYLKYCPGEDRSQKRLVSSKEAADIELAWEQTHALEERMRLEAYLKDAIQSKNQVQIAFAKVMIARKYKPELARELEREHCRLSILQYDDKTVFAGVEVNADSPNCCQQCKALAGKVYTVDQALQQCILPLDGCTEDRCFGWISPVFPEELVLPEKPMRAAIAKEKTSGSVAQAVGATVMWFARLVIWLVRELVWLVGFVFRQLR